MRPWTPNTRLASGGVRLSVKRACNGCGMTLGDITDQELVDATHGRDGRPLLDATSECGKCQGVHVLVVTPNPVDEGAEPEPGDWVITVECPGLRPGETVLSCASWEPCRCKAPEDELTEGFQKFLDQPCPDSPTGQHRFLSGAGFVGAPTDDCWYQVSDGTQEAAEEVTSGPGVYPVHVGAFDDTTPEFEVIADLAAYRKAATLV